jgi:VWFA-related protein
MRWTLAFLTILILSLTAAVQAPSETTTLKSRADLVLVPVVVHDKAGKHVSGLTAENFVLEDNGAREKIASLEEVMADKSVPGPPPELAADVKRGVIFTNQLANPNQAKELLIFVIDLVNAPFVDTEVGRRAMLGFIASHMNPNSTMALVSIESGQVRLLHSFTTSPTVLTSALQKVTAVANAPATQTETQAAIEAARNQQTSFTAGQLLATASGPQVTSLLLAQFISAAQGNASQAFLAQALARRDQNIASALESLRQVATWVSGVPGRKVLVWLTGDIPFVTGQGPISLGRLGAEQYERTMKALADANVAVYPVDVRGVVPQTMYVRGYVDPEWQQKQTLNEAQDSSSTGIAARSAALQRGVVHTEYGHDAMNYFANLTGGRAYYNHNDIQRVLDDASDDSTRYYMLSYYLDRSKVKPGWHKLKVKVERDGVTVRARNGYFVPKPSEEGSPSVRQQDESTALTSPFEYTALPVNLKWMDTAAQGDKRKVRFEVFVPPSSELVGGERNALDLDVIATAFDGTRSIAGQSSKAIKSQLKPQALEQVTKFGVTYISDLDVKPGDYVVRLVVRDNLSGRMGSITAPLKVGR